MMNQMNQKNQESADRRKKMRFELHREIRYKVLDGRKVVASGTGATLDMSSGGVCFLAQGELPVGAEIELSISWPALLNGNCPLRLFTAGKVLRSAGSMAVCTIGKFEYRTQGKITQMPASNVAQAPRPAAKPIAAAC